MLLSYWLVLCLIIPFAVPLSINTITEAVMKSEAGHSMTSEHIRASLVQLDCPPNGEVADETYNIGTVLIFSEIHFIQF